MSLLASFSLRYNYRLNKSRQSKLTLFNYYNLNRCFSKDTQVVCQKTRAEGGASRQKASPQERSRIRNIGIVAHINAGKTTTTERFLYYSGSTSSVGDVDHGNTVTDYLVQERDRGITITSAAVSFNWRKHFLNLIDTPGHVDFTIEVERSLSVLDGVITLLDASAGVEAQTVTVWNQARKYSLPNVIFLNKYDKPAANYDSCMKDLKSSLDISAKLVHLPIKTNKGDFSMVIDLIKRTLISWDNSERNQGARFEVKLLQDIEDNLDGAIREKIEEKREDLINFLSDVDEDLASHVIDCDRIQNVSSDALTKAVRRTTIDCKFSPVLVGSSFKYVGVQPLLDAVIDYLPSPIERESQIKLLLDKKGARGDNQTPTKANEDCAFIFKVMHDKRLGPLHYLRICGGSISRLQYLQVLESGKLEQIKKIYRPFADELKEIDQPVYKDDIVVATGLTESRTGDILVKQSYFESYSANSQAEQQPQSNSQPSSLILGEEAEDVPFYRLGKNIIIPHINQIEPVYYCSIEARSSSHQLKLESALARVAREDPSFTYEIDSIGLTTIRGMGKLHLEVVRDRLESEHGVDSILGPMQIAYRETIDGSATEELSVSRLINSVNNTLNIKLYVRSKPKAGIWTGKQLRLDSSSDSTLGRLRTDHRKAIELGFQAALAHGPSMGYPVIDCDILLLEFKANYRCGLPVISSASSQCLMNAINRCSPVLLEPIMLLEVVCPKEYNGEVLNDISARRGIILSTRAKLNNMMLIRSHTPLAALSDYSEFLRIATSGRASFSMELHGYVAMSEADKQTARRL